jgi:hypothetical protein
MSLLPAPAVATGAFVRQTASAQVYLLTQQGKRALADPALAPATVPQVSAAALAAFPDAGPLPAGTFVKGSTSGTVFALRGGLLRGIAAWGDLVALAGGSATPPILTVDQRIADLIPQGPLLVGPGSMVVSARSATVYFVNGPAELIPVSSFAVTGELGSTRLLRVDDAVVDAYTVRPGAITPVVDCAGTRYLGLGGKLYRIGADAAAHYPALPVTVLDASTCAALPKAATDLSRFLRGADGTIYYVANGVKRPITSYAAYLGVGGTSANTIQASAFALSLIPTGALLSSGTALQADAPATPAPSTTAPSSTTPATTAPATTSTTAGTSPAPASTGADQ